MFTPVGAVVIKKKSLGTALPLIVTGTHSDRVDVAAIAFRLRVYFGVSVDLTGRGLENFLPLFAWPCQAC